MKTVRFALLSGLLLAAHAFAQPAPRPWTDGGDAANAAAREELRRAQEDLRDLAARVGELTRQLGGDELSRALHDSRAGRAVIGVVIAADERRGVRLAAVTPEGPGARAGLLSGDRLLAIDGVAIAAGPPERRLERARELIGRPAEGQLLQLLVERDGREFEVEVAAERIPGFGAGIGLDELAERLRAIPQIQEFPFEIGSIITPFAGCGPDRDDCLQPGIADVLRWRGLRMARIEPELGRYFGTERGVLVLAVDREQLAPLLPGDVLLDVGGVAVDDPAAVMRALRDVAPGERVPLRLRRDGRELQVEIAAPHMSRLPSPPAPPAPPRPPQPPQGASAAPPAPAAVPAPPAPPAAPAPPSRGVPEQVLM
jgi:membrane-associated protease RseP (regulator of RpoE activity)